MSRRLWYIKKRNIKKINLLIRLLVIIILLVPMLFYAWESAFLIYENLTGTNLEQLVKEIIEEQISISFSDVDYGSIVDEKRDVSGNELKVTANMAVLSRVEHELEKIIKIKLEEAAREKCPAIRIGDINLKILVDYIKRDNTCKIGVRYDLPVSTRKLPLVLCKNVEGSVSIFERVYINGV